MDSKSLGRKLGIATLLISFICMGCSLSAQTIHTFAGADQTGYNGDGRKAVGAQLTSVTGGVTDKAGNVYVADLRGNRIRKIDAAGIITTIAGTGLSGYAPDGVKAVDANLAQPTGIVIDAQGNLYFSEVLNNRVRKIDVNGILTTVAGTGANGFTGNGGKAILAELQEPGALALDKEGNLYIADCGNNCIRKITPSGIISVFAGTGYGFGTGLGGYSGDGGKATAAMLNQPAGLAFDDAGNLYISDCFNHCIRKVNKQGIITTVAGTGEVGYSGDGKMAVKAQLKYPSGIAIDAKGNLYIADNGNYRVRMVAANGDINTVAGNGVQGNTGDGSAAISATIGKPTFVTIGNSGEVYFGDNLTGRIRVITETKTDNITNIPVHNINAVNHISATTSTGPVESAQ